MLKQQHWGDLFSGPRTTGPLQVSIGIAELGIPFEILVFVLSQRTLGVGILILVLQHPLQRVSKWRDDDVAGITGGSLRAEIFCAQVWQYFHAMQGSPNVDEQC